MGNVNMEAKQIHDRTETGKHKTVADHLKALDAVAQQIENLPTFTSNDRAFLEELPAFPSEDGKKVLTATTTSGNTSLSYDEIPNELPADPETDGVKVLTATTTSGETVKSWEDPASGTVGYSTSEVDTGVKWIDGKEIYQKTLVADLSVNANEDINITSLNIDTLIKTDLCCKYGTYQIGDSFFKDATTEFIRSYTRIDNDVMYLRVSRGSSYPISDAVYITILYTKTAV